MDKLWAPWRKAYLVKKPTSKSCFICRIKNSSRDVQHFVLRRTHYSFAVLNLFPYNNGHVMVIPNRHVNGLEKLNDTELLDLLYLMNQVIARIRKIMKPNGMNVGINLGRIAGAGLPGHVHIHAVPRWAGDMNFMPVIGDTKVISESLQSVYRRLRWGRSHK